ncbi:MAG: hypothetical protein QW315_01380 [Candidatus Hadarchaeum sp.]
MSAELKPLFEPKSIFLVGASELTGEEKIFSELFHSLVQNISSYKKGKVFLVDLSGRVQSCYKSVSKIKVGLDLAVAVLPEKLLARNLHKLLSRQPKFLVIVASKVGEELAKKTRKKTLIIGPESIGVINTKNGLIAVPGRWQIFSGDVAFISQDSCIAGNVLSLATTTGIGKLVNVDENFGIDESDILTYLSKDKETRCICVYLKKVRDGRKFIRALSETIPEKPVIVLSGSVAGAEILEAAVKQAGGIIVRDIREMLNGAAALVRQPSLHGEKVAVITNASGPAELFETHLSRKNMVLAKPSPETVEKIRKQHPQAEISNFIDLGKMADGDVYKRVAELLLSDEEVDGIVMINSMKLTSFGLEDLRKIAEIAKKIKEKPLVNVALCANDNAAFKEIVSESTLPIYSQVEEAAEAIDILRCWGKLLRKTPTYLNSPR